MAKKKAKKYKKDLSEPAYSLLKGLARKKRKSLLLSYNEYATIRNKGCEECKKPILGRSIGLDLLTKNGNYSKENVRVICGVCKASKAAEDFDYIKYSINQLRRGWKKTPNALLAVQKAKNELGEIQCKECNKWFPERFTQLDHIVPCVSPTEGFKSLDDFARKLLCKYEGLQNLCLECHKIKTRNERQLRKEWGSIKTGKQRKQEQRKLVR